MKLANIVSAIVLTISSVSVASEALAQGYGYRHHYRHHYYAPPARVVYYAPPVRVCAPPPPVVYRPVYRGHRYACNAGRHYRGCGHRYW